MLLFSLVLSLIALFTSPAAAEQSSACSLLTSSDIEVVTGGKMGVTQPLHFDDVPAGPNRSMKVLGCMYAVTSHTGQITISWFTGPVTDDDIARLITMSKSNVGTDDLKKANYKVVAKDFPHAWCSIMTPPPSDKDGVMLSTCAGGVKGQALFITFMSPTKALTIDQAKALLDKAAAHVH
jgi:hypothetical protein